MCNATNILNNLIYDNEGTGIVITFSSYSFIYNNLVTNNTAFGITIGGDSSQNRIYGNSIGWNVMGNAVGGNNDNFWDDGVSIGNFWNDFDSSLASQYEIDGSSNGGDHFPRELSSWSLVLPYATNVVSIEFIIVAAAGVGIVLVFIVMIFRKKGTIYAQGGKIDEIH